jgi:hypothetical protein
LKPRYNGGVFFAIKIANLIFYILKGRSLSGFYIPFRKQIFIFIGGCQKQNKLRTFALFNKNINKINT